MKYKFWNPTRSNELNKTQGIALVEYLLQIGAFSEISNHLKACIEEVFFYKGFIKVVSVCVIIKG